MRISFFCLILLLTQTSVWAAAKIERWHTKQGAKVYYVHTEGLPMVDIRVSFDAGSARDDYQYGLAALTSNMLDTGAGPWSADDIAQRFESVGAQFGNGISRDTAWLSLRTLTQEELFDKAVDTLHLILTEPHFSEEDFEREKKRTLAGLKHREESPAAQAAIAFYNALYGDHPYAHPSSGVIETVAGFETKNLNDFYKQYYVASNAIVVIVGDLSQRQAKKTAQRLLAGLPVGEKPAPLAKVTMPESAQTQKIAFPSTQTHVLAGFPGVYRKDPDYFNLYVANHILGGSGLVSKLFKEVREKRGLAYSAYSYFAPLLRKGPFMMGLQTRNEQAQKAVQVMHDTLVDYVENGPSEEELLAAKKNITGGFVLRFDTNSKLTSYVEMIAFYDLPLNYLDTFQEKINAVTLETLKDALKRRVKPELLQTITVGNSGAGK